MSPLQLLHDLHRIFLAVATNQRIEREPSTHVGTERGVNQLAEQVVGELDATLSGGFAAFHAGNRG